MQDLALGLVELLTECGGWCQWQKAGILNGSGIAAKRSRTEKTLV